MFSIRSHPRERNWIPKAKKCIFLGYGALRKGCRLYDRNTSSILHCRDVVFNELSRGYDSEGEKQLIEVEGFLEEPEEVPEQEAQESVAEANGDLHGVMEMRERKNM